MCKNYTKRKNIFYNKYFLNLNVKINYIYILYNIFTCKIYINISIIILIYNNKYIHI